MLNCKSLFSKVTRQIDVLTKLEFYLSHHYPNLVTFKGNLPGGDWLLI